MTGSHYIRINCIQCNQCSLVCPHGVIRPLVPSNTKLMLRTAR
ncbi:MAG: 4Fe-4S binding protein [Bacillota bacterium]